MLVRAMVRRLPAPLAVVCLALAAESAFGMPAPSPPCCCTTKVSDTLGRYLKSKPNDGTVAAWIELQEPPRATPIPVSPASAARRSRRGLPTADLQDLPLDAMQVEAIRARVQRIRTTSRFLRSVAVDATPAQLARLAELPFVACIDLVAKGRRRPDGDMAAVARLSPLDAGLPDRFAPAGPPYGGSQQQLALMRVPELHDRGLTGLGILIAHFDTGYERFTHQVFRTLKVVAMRDFVDNDGDPTQSADPLESGEHGTITLSVVGGFRPGTLVGSAFGASFALARTERSSLEESFEEDLWIAALEWADSLGADIISSSLKFREVDIGVGYSWVDMDGATARVTQAAAIAEQRGILIFQGAGNDGYNPLRNTLVAPADGIDVMAIGATTMRNTIAGFSSCGPTTDPPARIKPDVVAPGENVWAASTLHDSAYAPVSGTSLSTPLAAGVAALLLSVHPAATPAQIRQVMRTTASHAVTPDIRWGWGMIDAMAAHQALIALFPTDAQSIRVRAAAPEFANPFRPHDAIAFALESPAQVTLRVYDAAGRRVRELAQGAASARSHRVVWSGEDDAGHRLPRGTYFVELRTSRGGAAAEAATRKLTLLQR